MKLTQYVIKRPIATLMILLAIVVFGISSVFQMPLELTPEMNFPMLGVITVYPTAGPEDVEKLVTKEVEDSVGSLSGLKKVTSYSMENMSLIMLQYEYGTDIDNAYTDAKEKLDSIRNSLPDTAEAPIIMEVDINAQPVITLSVGGETENLLYTVEEEILPELENLSSISDITVNGGQEEYIRVEIAEEKMQQYGVNMNTIVSSLANADFSIPAGEGELGNRSLPVRSLVEYHAAEELRNIPIPLNQGGTIRLSDVANIYEATKDMDSVSRFNGQDDISISIQKRQSASAVSVSRDVSEVVTGLEQKYPELDFHVVSDTSDQIVDSLTSVASTLVLAIILSMLVLYLFFGDWKASLIVGSSMPVSVLITLILMSAMGFSLNIVTLTSLVLAIGMMVDNSIVVIDSCFKARNNQRTFAESAVEGTKFVLLSIIASTVTTVVVFVPLATIQGMSGQMFKPLGFTLAFAMIASLISAMTLVPLFFSKYKPEEKKTAPAARLLKRLEHAYGNLLRKILNKKKTVVSVSLALLIAAFWMASQLNMEMVGNIDEGTIAVEVDTMPGLKVERIDEIMLDLENMVSTHPDVERYSYTASTGGESLTSFNSSDGTITAYLRDGREMDTKEVIDQWRKESAQMLDCEVSVNATSSMNMGMGSADDYEINIKGNDMDTLRAVAGEITNTIAAHPDIISASSTVDNPSPQVEIKVDAMKASAVGYTPLLVAADVNKMLSGVETVSITQGGQEYDIWVEYPADKYRTINDISQMIMVSPSGVSVPIQEIATIEYSDTPQTIHREDNQYMVTISGTPTQSAKFTVAKDLDQQIQAIDLPEGVSLADSQMNEQMGEEFGYIGIAIATAVFLVFIVMAIQFESVKHSLMVMICIPFSLIGSFLLLYLTKTPISMVSLLGFLILVGTVVNNGILFVDTTNQYRKSMELHTALIRTGRNRLRSILMTTLTTVLSMLPT